MCDKSPFAAPAPAPAPPLPPPCHPNLLLRAGCTAGLGQAQPPHPPLPLFIVLVSSERFVSVRKSSRMRRMPISCRPKRVGAVGAVAAGTLRRRLWKCSEWSREKREAFSTQTARVLAVDRNLGMIWLTAAIHLYGRKQRRGLIPEALYPSVVFSKKKKTLRCCISEKEPRLAGNDRFSAVSALVLRSPPESIELICCLHRLSKQCIVGKLTKKPLLADTRK